MDIKELAKKYELNDNDFWKHKQSGKWIITHDACEKIADQENISFVLPEIYTDNNSDVAMIGSAKKGDKVVWSTGEASSRTCAMKYYWAMAEKRLKDRLTLKIINAYQYGVSSETEADDFKRESNNITEEMIARFDKLLSHDCFKGKKTEVKKKWAKLFLGDNPKVEGASALAKMETSIKEFEEAN